MLSISKEANENYLAKIVELKNIRKHNNADRLQVVSIDFQDVITGLDAKEGDIYVYFPVESKINKDFLSFTNSFRKKELNDDPEKVGFFEENCRVKAVKLRGEKSMGYIVPSNEISAWANFDIFVNNVGQEFDTIGGKLLVEKYFVPTISNKRDNQGKKPRLSRLIDGQIHLHTDTQNLRKNIHKLSPENIVSITYKTHGTSWWVSNVLTKKPLKWYEKLVKKLGVSVEEQIYDIVYGSRRVVKNKHLEDPKNQDHYFGYDLWKEIKDEVAEKIPKGYTLYGECLGYKKDGGFIQGPYDYGCEQGKFKLEVYRITHTTPDGLVTEFTYPQIQEFCDKVGLNVSHLFYYGKAGDLKIPVKGLVGKQHETVLQPNLSEDSWRDDLICSLEEDYNEKDCFMCKNKVPEEGIVVRKESLFSCESYKLKSFKFLEQETKELDKGTVNIEEQN